MFAPTRIGRDSELFEVGAARVGPSLVVTLTQTMAAGAASAVGDAAGPSAEYGVVRGELQYVAAEFGANTGHEPAQQAQRRVGIQGGHSLTWAFPMNQPACSMAFRASSTFRCPYVAAVTVTLAWPSSLATTSKPIPSRSILVAAV